MTHPITMRRLLLLSTCLSLPALAVEGPTDQTFHYCSAPAWSGDPSAVIAWQEGPTVVVQAARERDAVPAYLFADHNPPAQLPRVLRLAAAAGFGLRHEAGQLWLQVSPTLKLACQVSHAD